MLWFDWDQANLDHIAAHGVNAEEAEYVLSHPTLELDAEERNGEERFLESGETAAGRILVIASTVRGLMIRVVTAYDAPPVVSRAYHRFRRSL